MYPRLKGGECLGLKYRWLSLSKPEGIKVESCRQCFLLLVGRAFSLTIVLAKQCIPDWKEGNARQCVFIIWDHTLTDVSLGYIRSNYEMIPGEGTNG